MLTEKQQIEILLIQRNLLVGTLNEVLAHSPDEQTSAYVEGILKLVPWPPTEELEK